MTIVLRKRVKAGKMMGALHLEHIGHCQVEWLCPQGSACSQQQLLLFKHVILALKVKAYFH